MVVLNISCILLHIVLKLEQENSISAYHHKVNKILNWRTSVHYEFVLVPCL